MTFAVVTVGDALECLSALTRRSGTVDGAGCIPDEARRRVRGLVVGVDLGHAQSPRQARATLKREVLRWEEALRRHTAAIHLMIAYRRPAGMTAGHVINAADSLSLRVHTDMERKARYVDVTLLDVTECDDSERLADRLLERIAGRAGGHPTAALTWSEIRDQSITTVTAARNA